jgi:hypothetical protein
MHRKAAAGAAISGRVEVLPPASSLTERRHRRRAMDRQPSSPPSLPTFSCCFCPSPSVLPPSAATHCDCRRPQFSSRLPQLPYLNGRRCTHDTPHHASPPFLVCLVSPPNHLTVRPLELPPSMICVPASLRALSPLTSSYVIRVSIETYSSLHVSISSNTSRALLLNRPFGLALQTKAASTLPLVSRNHRCLDMDGMLQLMGVRVDMTI